MKNRIRKTFKFFKIKILKLLLGHWRQKKTTQFTSGYDELHIILATFLSLAVKNQNLSNFYNIYSYLKLKFLYLKTVLLLVTK